MKVGVIIDHSKALEIIKAAGAEPPIPQGGENTAHRFFRTVDGDHALAINQTGFSPEAADNEEQVNGLSLLIALEEADAATAESILLKTARKILERP